MPNSTDPQVTSKQDDQKTVVSSPSIAGPPKAKEQEPPHQDGAGQARGEDDKIMAEIKSSAEAVDAQALANVREVVADARGGHPQPQLPADVADAGVISPQAEADKVVAGGATINLPIDETTYKKGLHVRVAGVVKDKVVVGVLSLAALAMWVGRLIKMAHKHTMKVIFKKEGD